MSTEMGDRIPDIHKPEWSVEVAVTNGRVRVSCFGPVEGEIKGGKVFLDQAGARMLMEQLQAAHAYNNWQPYPEIEW